MATPRFTPFDAEGGLIFATRLPGSSEDFDEHRRGWDELAAPESEPPLWIHLDRTRPRAQQWVREESGLDPLVVESLLAEETRPRVQAVGHGMIVILRGVNLNPGAEPDELIAIRMWLEPTRILTLRQFRFQTVAEMRRAAEAGEGPTTASEFLAKVSLGLALRMNPTVANLEEMIDDIEDEMLDQDEDTPQRRSMLATIRRQAIRYRRFLVPQRDALLTILVNPPLKFAARDEGMLRHAAEHTTRISEALEEIRDRAAVTQDELRARHEQRMGRTLYLLTIVATVALPLGLLTGLLGINVGGIPLSDSSLGFVVVCVALVVIAAAEIWYFRRRRLL